jgi:hypothetical protein
MSKNNNVNKTKRRRARKQERSSSNGAFAMGTNLQGPLSLKQEQFAAWAPLLTFKVTEGTTPGGIRVRGRELIVPAVAGLTTLIYGGGGLTSAASINLNPVSFPRLAAYAPIYEWYIFHKGKLMYQSNQPTTASGVNILSVEYDPKDTAPVSTVAQMRNISSSMGNVYANNACEFSRSLSRLPRFSTGENTAPDVDQINQAVLNYAFEGITQAGTAVGYIIVEYDVEFFTPQ